MDFPHIPHHPNPQLHSQRSCFIQTTTPQLKSKRRSSTVPMSFPQPPPQFNNINLNPAAAIVNPISMDAQLQSALDHIDELITDHSHFTARWLTALKEKAGLQANEWTIAKVLVNLAGMWLTISDKAEFLSNGILVGVPLMLFFVYPEEKADDQDMLIYWPCYAFLTLFDFLLQSIPAYYPMKLLLFAAFFLRPWRLAQKLRIVLAVRQLYMAGAHTLHQGQESIHELQEQIPTEMLSLPPEMLSKWLPALAGSGSSTLQAPPEQPPASLMVPPIGSAQSCAKTARQGPSSQQSSELIVAGDAAAPRQQPTQPSSATIGNQTQGTMGQRSTYQDLRPKPKPYVVGGSQESQQQQR